MVAFIDDHKRACGVEPTCRVPIAPSTYYAFEAVATEPSLASARAKRDASICTQIRRVWEQNFRVCEAREVRLHSTAKASKSRYTERLALTGIGDIPPAEREEQYRSTLTPQDETARLNSSGLR